MTDIPIGFAGVLCTALLAAGATATATILRFVPKRESQREPAVCGVDTINCQLVERMGIVETEQTHTTKALDKLTDQVEKGFAATHKRLDNVLKDK